MAQVTATQAPKGTKAQGPSTPKNKGMVSNGPGKAPKLVTPPSATAANPFGAFVATQQKQAAKAATVATSTANAVTMPNTGVAVQQAAKAGFTRTVQNGRGDYTPNSIGALIWQTAIALQAVTPNTPIQASAVRTALPHIKPASISAGLSHWRKFNGTLRVKGQVPAPIVVPALVGPVKPE